VKPNVLAVLRADGFVDRLGADRIHGNVHRAVEAQLQNDTRRDEGTRAARRPPLATDFGDPAEGGSEDR
jgi:hypothetical protein